MSDWQHNKLRKVNIHIDKKRNLDYTNVVPVEKAGTNQRRLKTIPEAQKHGTSN